MREDDRRLGQGQHLIEDVVRGMAGVDHDAKPVHLGDPPLAERAQAMKFRLVGGGITELIDAEMHRPGQANAKPAEGLQHRKVGAERVGILHALEYHALAGGLDARRIGGAVSQFELVGVRGDHFMNMHRTHHRPVARRSVALRRQRSLRRIKREETAIQTARHHARIIHLGHVVMIGMPRHHIPAGPPEMDRRIQMGIEPQRLVGPDRSGGQSPRQNQQQRFSHASPLHCPTVRSTLFKIIR